MSKVIRGNLSPEQIQGAKRQGDSSIIQMTTGSVTPGNFATWDASDNLVDGGGWQSWTPTLGGFGGSLSMTSPTGVTAKYIRIGAVVHWRLGFTSTISGSGASFVVSGMPVAESLGQHCLGVAALLTIANLQVSMIGSGLEFFSVGANFPTGSWNFVSSGTYQCA